MKNIKKVAERIKEAAKENEKIVLFGDADLDGVTSVIILEETIKKIGGNSVVYISDRRRWGYGISEKAVSSFKKEAPAILISLDCGISSFQGAKKAKEEGFELIIIDHHKTLSELPEASLILDPWQKGDKSSFKKLANAGIVYMLSRKILGEKFFGERQKFLELAALATVADMVPREKDNKKILNTGVEFLQNPSNLSLSVLKQMADKDFVEHAVSLLNITPPKGKVNKAYLFLTEKKKKTAEKMARKLEEDHKERRKMIQDEEQRILSKIKGKEEIVFEEGNFPSHFAGSLASRIIKKHKKPVFLYTKEGDTASGSARALSGQDVVKAMSSCKKHLESFGGHAVAAGFVVKTKNTEKFKKCLINYFKKQ